ncbi:MAG: winged helix-turn-helix domain-containing protein [Candidatus Solibacter usitatus]|nr:winged helix-turn-helix domain-containing protein [Candidatus Solibacter usitatus]
MSSISNNRKHFYEFGPFRLSEAEGVLRRGDQVLQVAPKAVDLLLVLVQNAGQVVSTEDLLKSVWADCIVETSNLHTQITSLRRAIGREIIKTVPKRGYQFIGMVQESWEPASTQEPPAEVPGADPGIPGPPADRGPFRFALTPLIASVLAIAGALFALRLNQLTAPVSSVPAAGRLLALLTCEGCRPAVIKLDRMPGQVLMNPSGTKVYAIERGAKTITVVGLLDNSVKRTLILPLHANTAVMTRHGERIYIGSSTDGVMVVDAEQDRVLERIFATGGPVRNLAVTPDEKKVFLAMGAAGLKRISMVSGEIRLLSEIACPEYVGIDPSGRELFVSYQCGGPGGHRGHDSVEVYDVESERRVAIVTGPPMVGSSVSFAPGSPFVLLNGQDACSAPSYDHIGCPIVPGIASHLLRSADRTIVRTFAREVNLVKGETNQEGTFVPDGRRLVFSGPGLTVLDVSKQAVLETYADARESYGQVVFDATGRRAVVVQPAGLLVLKTLDQPCLPPEEGQFNLYPGDGSFDDVRQVERLVPEGDVTFVPGLIGQALRLNGKDSMLRARPWAACGDCGDSWTESLFVKFDALQGEMTLLERANALRGPGHRLFKSPDNRIVLEIAGDTSPGQAVHSTSPVTAETWNHYAVVVDAGERRLYINGTLMGSVAVPKADPIRFWGDVCLGSTHERSAHLAGRVDEIVFYNRALGEPEIRRISQLRTDSPCRH